MRTTKRQLPQENGGDGAAWPGSAGEPPDGGTDLALCSDLLVIADDAKIGYPPARVWGSPTTSLWAHRLGDERAKRLLLTGDCLSGAEGLEWGLAIEAPSADRL